MEGGSCSEFYIVFSEFESWFSMNARHRLQRIEGYYGPVYENFALRDPVLATAVEVGVVCVRACVRSTKEGERLWGREREREIK